ncbi:MAG: hypothetical protein Q8N51_13815, partial [Gammaproteobacteria bacterium]|nr:hypothetical protein [Gammaproteobacteria bacterium]
MFSIRDVLTAVFLVLIAVAAAAVWLLADTYNQRNTDQLAGRIQRELAGRIEVRIGDVLASPHSLNAMGESIIRGGQLDLSDPAGANRVFHGVLPANPHVNALFFGGADGSMWGARWSRDGRERDVMLAGAETAGALNYYRAGTTGNPGELVESAPDYDPRDRPWYRGAVSSSGPVWSPIYF